MSVIKKRFLEEPVFATGLLIAIVALVADVIPGIPPGVVGGLIAVLSIAGGREVRKRVTPTTGE